MAGLGIALRGLGKAVKKGISKSKFMARNMSDKSVGTLTMAGVGAAVVGGGELLKRKKKKNPRLRKSKP